jgi:acyl dehydratase
MDLDAIRAWNPTVEQSYTPRDTMLYALSLGYGEDPLDGEALRFVYERELRTIPSMAMVLAQNKFWLMDPIYGVDTVRLLHAEQSLEMHQPLAAEGRVRAQFRVAAVEDKGAERGALLHQLKELVDAETDAPIAAIRYTLLLRGNGGEGGFGDPVEPAPPLPDRTADRAVKISTRPGAALLYRLSGDYNPLHADPEIARKAGFNRPILHGLCTMGIACRVILSTYCDNDPSRLTGLFNRFTRPVFPGETLMVEFFEEADWLGFRGIAVERGNVVLDRGRATIV